MRGMTRKQAIGLFGSVNRTAAALGVTRSAVNKWPAELPQRIADRVRGARSRWSTPVPMPSDER